ncbi:small GTP-binding protein [Histomonas meleagridis]|uniref:small GTP-binding protein n=1 Tax=Histomonas meleagridis TaxID=135588 RepID=UPI00355A768D|nr:small GTP-binding protein [Histomonas meleagridis]KAH0801066.1 small GTP-binding protein [Histomonas meleagridis]
MSGKTKDFKVVLLGPYHVGKTSIIERYCNNVFIAKTKQTVGAGFFTKTLTIDSSEVTLMIWDTAGDERFKAITPSLLHGANCMMLVFDLSSSQSFTGVEDYLNLFLNSYSPTNNEMPVILVGNKMDLPQDQIEVPQESIDSWLSDHHVEMYQAVSALSGQNIDHAFDQLIKYLLKNEVKTEEHITFEIKPAEPVEKTEEEKKCC